MVGKSNLSVFVFCQLTKLYSTDISANKLNLNLNLPRRLVVQEIGVSRIGETMTVKPFFKCSRFTVHT